MFSTHKLNERGFQKINEFKNKMSLAVSEAMLSMPAGNLDILTFKRKVEEAMFYGSRCIASDPENHSEITEYQEVTQEMHDKMEKIKQDFLKKVKEQLDSTPRS